MRAAPRTLFGSYCHEHTRGRQLIVLALQATMDSDIPAESRSDSLFLRGRHDAQEPQPVGTGGRLSKKMSVLPAPLRQAVCLAETTVIPPALLRDHVLF